MGRADGIERSKGIGSREQGVDRCDSGSDVGMGQLCALNEAILSFVKRNGEDVGGLYKVLSVGTG